MSERLRALLVEDSEDDALLLERELKRGGYAPETERVYTAAKMEEALDRGEWDIVICDHSMPAFSSSMALKTLRRRGCVDTPFIIVSGRIGEDAAVSAMRDGANDYFMKDNLARLNTAIGRELREAENRRERRRAREALAESEERYRTFIAQSTEGIWRAEFDEPMDMSLPEEAKLEHLYANMYFAECNDAMARMYGFERADALIGMRLGDLVPRDVPENLAFLRDAIRYGEADERVGYRVTDSESKEFDRWGEARYFLNNFVGMVEDGLLVRLWGTQRDITESKRAQKALQEAEEKYRGIFENSIQGIYQSTEAGDLVTANPAMARILGYDSPEEMIERISDTRDLYARPSGRGEFRRHARERGDIYGLEIEMRRKDGGFVWTSVSGRVAYGPDGEPTGYEGVIEDISARREAEEALKQSEALYRTVVESAAENIFIVDVETKRILEANEALGRSLGYSAEDLKRMTLYDLIAVDERSEVDANIGRIVAEGSLRVGERNYLRKDGSHAIVEVEVSMISYGGVDAMCIIAHDVTERKRAEKELGEIREAERRRISRDLHDGVLQDLTYAIQSMQIEHKLHGGRREEEGRRIDSLRRAVAGLRDAIYDLRLESVQQQTLTRSIEALVELNRQMTPEREIELRVEGYFPDDLWGRGAAEVARAVQEALVNVRRHSGASRAEVDLNLDGDEAVLEVSDDGKGFEGGSLVGVGLSSMKERVEALGGSLEIEGSNGTRVVLRVPLSALREGVPQTNRA